MSVLRPGRGLPDGLTIPDGELVERFSRSSGPGGQSVNTTDSRVELSLGRRRLGGADRSTAPAAARAAGRPAGRRRADDRGVRAPLAAAEPHCRPGPAAASRVGRPRTTVAATPGHPPVARGQGAPGRGQAAARQPQERAAAARRSTDPRGQFDGSLITCDALRRRSHESSAGVERMTEHEPAEREARSHPAPGPGAGRRRGRRRRRRIGAARGAGRRGRANDSSGTGRDHAGPDAAARAARRQGLSA